MKYKIIRILDLAGLRVFEPVVLLCCGEEPRKQLKKIGLFICIPVATFIAFLGAWSYVGPRHKTKSGEVPGPRTVVDAWQGIVQFANRENAKGRDFALDGKKREKELAKVQHELASVESALEQSKARFEKLEAKRAVVIDDKLSVYEKATLVTQDKFEKQSIARVARLRKEAASVPVGDIEARTRYLQKIQEHLAVSTEESKQLTEMRNEIDERRGEKWSVLEVERKRKNSLEQQRQFLKKRVAYLGKANRSTKVAAASGKLEEQKRAYLATTGPALFDAGLQVVKSNERLGNLVESEYAQPPTFFMYIRTSLACVFLGFLIATSIAIPIGVLCGLSPVFMAAMSPLISLFKPVSPIVWLPIVFIIVGGFNLPEFTGYWSWFFAPSFLASAITVALCSLWPTLVNTALGVSSIDQDHINVARVLRLGFWSRLAKIVIPSALPLIFTGLRISLGVGWMVLIAAELLSSSPGLGKFVWDMFNNGSSETFSQMFVVVFVVGLIGLLLDRIMIVFQRIVSFDGASTAL